MEISCDNYRNQIRHHQDESTTTTTTTQTKIQRKRKNSRRYFRHETLEMFKLGVSNNNNKKNLDKPARKNTDLETFMKPSIPTLEITQSDPTKKVIIVDDDDDNNNNNNNYVDNNKSDGKLFVPTCAKVPVICSPISLKQFNDNMTNNHLVGGNKESDKNDNIKIHSIIKINPGINQHTQSRKLSTGFMIRDLLEMEVNKQKPPPPPLPQPEPPLPQPRPPPLINSYMKKPESTNTCIQPIQFPMVPSKPRRKLNSLPPQSLPLPVPLYQNRQMRPNFPYYQQYNHKLPVRLEPSPTTSSTINTTIPSQDNYYNRNDRLPCLYERFNQPIVTGNSLVQKQQQQQQQSGEDTNLVKCVIKHSIFNPDSSYFGTYRLKPLDKRIPQGKLCFIKEKHGLLRYFDDNEKRLYLSNINNKTDNINMNDKRLFIQLPIEICFNPKEQLTVEEYVIEMEIVRRFVPLCFYQFYKYVTGYQIVHQKLPVSFLTFLNVYNTNGLLDLKRRYIRSLKE